MSIRWSCSLLCLTSTLTLACGSKSSSHQAPPPDGDGGLNARNQNSPYTAVVEGLPQRSNAKTITVRVTGHSISSFRYKISPEGSTDCSSPEGYGSVRPINTELTIDQSQYAEGRMVICTIGLASTGEARTQQTASRSWSIDRTGPRAFEIKPIGELGTLDKPIVVRWTTPQDEASTGYELKLSRLENGCDHPLKTVRTTTTEASFNEKLTHGRYILCLTAFDDLGNPGDAANSGTAFIDTPTVAHVAYFKGSSVEDKKLYYATRSGFQSPWVEKSVSLTAGANRFLGGASLQLTGAEEPQLAFQAMEPVDLAPPQSVARLASIVSGNFDVQRLDAAAAPEGTTMLTPLVLGARGEYHLFFSRQSESEGRLTHISGTYGQTPVAEDLGAVAADAAISDAAAVFDASGALHFAYVSGGHLFYRTKTDAWTEPTDIPQEGCQHIDFASLAVARVGTGVAAAGKPPVGLAYLCSKETPEGSACELRLAQPVDAAGRQWQTGLVTAIGSGSGCDPFSADRPTLALDYSGKAYVAYRYPQADGSGNFDIAVAAGTLASGFRTLAKFEDWHASTGFPKLTLDASYKPSLTFLGGGGIRYAWQDVDERWRFETIVPLEPGAYLEPADLVISGGSSRAPAAAE